MTVAGLCPSCERWPLIHVGQAPDGTPRVLCSDCQQRPERCLCNHVSENPSSTGDPWQDWWVARNPDWYADHCTVCDRPRGEHDPADFGSPACQAEPVGAGRDRS